MSTERRGARAALPARLGGFVIAVARRFYDDHCLVRASALAYTSLLSMVPLLAVMFAVLKGLGAQDELQTLLLSRLSLSQEAAQTIAGYVEHVNVGTIGGLGAALLLFTVISVLGGVEASFNHIWRVARSRSLWRQVTDYLSVVLLTPFLLLAAVALTSSMQADKVIQWVLASEYVGPLALRALELLPVAINVLAIGVLYAVMPNRRPSPAGIAAGALFAGVAWHLVQLAYIHFQIGMANYNAIYGALSQLPITLVWLYVSWAVVLLGAEIAAVFEFGWRHVEGPAVPVDPLAVRLHLLVRAAESFRADGEGIETRRSARELGVPVEVVNAAVAELQRLGWLAAVEGRGSFLLARDPRRISLGEIGSDGAASRHGVPRRCDPRVSEALQRLDEQEQKVWREWTLADVMKGDGE